MRDELRLTQTPSLEPVYGPQSGIERGWFQAEKTSVGRGRPSLPVLLHIASMLADAMAYLHDRDIIHGDLCGGNVLLTSCDSVPHRFTCKVWGKPASQRQSWSTGTLAMCVAQGTEIPGNWQICRVL